MFKICLGDFWDFLGRFKGKERLERWNQAKCILMAMSKLGIEDASEVLDALDTFKEDILYEDDEEEKNA